MSDQKDTKESGKAKIKVTNHPDFPVVDRSTTMSTMTMDKMFKSLIGSIFKDTFGLRPSWNLRTNRLTVSAYFDQGKQNPNDVVAFKMNSIDGSSEGFERINRFYNLQSASSMFTLTDEAKEALAPFMADEAKNRDGSIRWNDLDVVAQAVDPSPSYGLNKTYNVINFLNPIALLEAIYGNKVKVVDISDGGEPVVVEHDASYTIEVLGVQITNDINSAIAPFQFMADPSLAASNPNTYNQIMNRTIVDPCVVRIFQIDKIGLDKATGNLGLRYQNSLKIDQ